MVAAKTERLLNLVICLLYTRRPLTKSQIRRAVVQYDQTGDEAFDRMFERDKDELRDLGIPLVTEHLDTFFEDEPGYRIDKREYALPAITFTPDELAVLRLAGRVWSQASLAGPAAQALRKLAAAGVERDDASLIGVEARVGTSEPAFDAVKSAVVAGYPIRFGYRRPEDAAATERHVQPWALTSWRGRWYVTGFDTDRQAPRVFRLSRIEGAVRRDGSPGSFEVPPEHDPRAMVRGQNTPDPAAAITALVRVRDGAGNSLRRRAEQLAGDADPGWSMLRIADSDLFALADEVAGYGPDAVVIEPPELRLAVRQRLLAAANAHEPQLTGKPGDQR